MPSRDWGRASFARGTQIPSNRYPSHRYPREDQSRWNYFQNVRVLLQSTNLEYRVGSRGPYMKQTVIVRSHLYFLLQLNLILVSHSHMHRNPVDGYGFRDRTGSRGHRDHSNDGFRHLRCWALPQECNQGLYRRSSKPCGQVSTRYKKTEVNRKKLRLTYSKENPWTYFAVP